MRILLSLAEPALRARVEAALADRHDLVTRRDPPPDLLLTDTADLVPAVRDTVRCHHTPAIVLLDPWDEDAADAAVALGASDVLPADLPEAALRRAVAARANEVAAGRAAEREAGAPSADRDAIAFRSMAESGILGISFFTLDGRVRDANDRYLKMIGATREDLAAGEIRWDRLTPPEWMPRTQEAIAELKAKGRCRPFEKEYRRLDGSRFWAYFGGAVLGDGEAVAFVLDTEESHEAKLILERQALELARSNEELQGFAYAASHDLREPLRMINIYSQLLRRMYDRSLGPQALEFIEGIASGVKRMDHLLGDLLTYARLGADTKPSRLPVDCNEIVEEVHMALQAPIEESGAWVDYDDLPVVLGVPVQVRQLFQNLVSNAIKYRSELPPEIYVSAKRQGADWLFDVRDNGMGVPKGHETSIFGVFKRLHAQTHEGTGMGLAICKRIVERHGGRIWVEPNPAGGSIFRFTLPGDPTAMAT